MNAQYFIDKFSAIPEEDWCVGSLTDPIHLNRHCVLGHCGERRGVYEDTPETSALKMLFATFHIRPDDVNDYQTRGFKQATPKARILAALEYIKALGVLA